MKRLLAALLITIMAMLNLTSCESYENVVQVKCDGTTFKTIYLYYFEDADITGYEGTGHEENYYYYYGSIAPTESGYVYSNQKLSVGDEIKVWEECDFSKGTSKVSGTTAVVKELVETYGITVSSSSDRFDIVFYTVGDSNALINGKYCATEKSDLESIVENKVNVPQETTYIVYDTED